MPFVSLRASRRTKTIARRRVGGSARRNLCALVVLGSSLLLSSDRAARGGTLVRFEVADFGVVLVDLFDNLSPISVANFMLYIDANRYDESMIHRVDTGLGVIQGGGFYPDASSIDTFGMINAEIFLPNTRGTLAMARSPSGVNTASSQWFINTDDNSIDLHPSTTGGYTVFGRVVGGGMNVVDAIAAVPTFAFEPNPPFGQVPLVDYTQQDYDNRVDPVPDVLLDEFAAHANHGYQIMGPFAAGDYIDTSGDGNVSPRDLLLVYNGMLRQIAGPLTASPAAMVLTGPSVAAFAASPAATVVPEPASGALAGAAVLALACWAVARRRRGR
jgi:cyclophilin family peptidyl-prolyl cis-trans isomerase